MATIPGALQWYHVDSFLQHIIYFFIYKYTTWHCALAHSNYLAVFSFFSCCNLQCSQGLVEAMHAYAQKNTCVHLCREIALQACNCTILIQRTCLPSLHTFSNYRFICVTHRNIEKTSASHVWVPSSYHHHPGWRLPIWWHRKVTVKSYNGPVADLK